MDLITQKFHGNTFLEVVWTVIPILIVIALSVPTVQTIYSLEKAPEATKDKEPLVVYATSVDWKWVFSYPEQDIETVNYLNIPDRPPDLVQNLICRFNGFAMDSSAWRAKICDGRNADGSILTG